ncbi:hypothetical protein V6N12_024751 [Hibiscus sabdariffa]|uniref:IFT140 first beta-propeller domain-containing protein n=1 Tax=Hibiscus sabdariffa TaxID=183260 RepID=A0ABR2BH66_9ROSI
MMYGDPQHQQNQLHPQGGEFQRGPPPPQMMRQPSASSTTLNSEYHHHAPPPQNPPYDAHGDNFAAKRMRKMTQRRAVDYTSTVVRYMQIRMSQRDSRDRTTLQPTPAAAIDMLPAAAYLDNPSTSFAAKFVHTSLNKNRCSINCVLWTPSGRRLITGSQSGEFTLWNGQSFNFEMILQAHDQAIRSMIWSHNDNWMVSGDDGGAIKYWKNNMNNVKVNKSAHKESVRDLSFCRTDLKFCSCSDDTTVKVWDFARCQEERSLTGHGWDVKSVDWHPTKSLLVSGGKDNLVKLWDAKTGREVCSFHGHKNTVLCVKWNQNGNWVLTAGKDQIIKLYDIRTMKELESFRGHRKDVTALSWHPFHEEYFVSGSFDGSIFHWLVGNETPQVDLPSAHDNSVWDIAWHPIGYLLCSGSNDHTTKFWCRNRPGDTACDKFNIGQNQGYVEQNPALAGHMPGNFAAPEGPTTPGPFATRNEGTIPGIGVPMPLSVPSLDASSQGDQKQIHPGSMPFGAPPLPPGPHPSLLANQQHGYQQNPQQIQQQAMQPMPRAPPNMPQLQPPSHSHMPLHLRPHPHLQRPPLQMPPHGMPSPVPSSMPGSFNPPSSIPGPLGTMNQMPPPLPQGHYMGMNPMHSGSLPTSGGGPSVGGFPSGLQNMQGSANMGSGQMYPQGGAFSRAQGGQMPMMPRYNPYQTGGQSGMPSQPPSGPPPHGQMPQ